MNNNELDQIWNSCENRPGSGALAPQAEQFLKRLRSRHRGFVLVMSLAGFWLALVLLRLAALVAKGGDLHLRQEWASLAMLSLPLSALILFINQYRRHRLNHAQPERSIHASLLALLDENRLAIARMKVIAGLHLGVLLLMPFALHQLRAAGKAGDELLFPAFVLLPLLVAAILATMAWCCRTRLLPRRRELREMLAAYS